MFKHIWSKFFGIDNVVAKGGVVIMTCLNSKGINSFVCHAVDSDIWYVHFNWSRSLEFLGQSCPCYQIVTGNVIEEDLRHEMESLVIRVSSGQPTSLGHQNVSHDS